VVPIRLEVIAHTLEGLGTCTTCQLVLAEAGVGQPKAEQALAEFPPEWQADVRRLSEWIGDLARRYGEGIQIRIIDPQSPAGLLKSLRFRVRHYPTWIVEGHDPIAGWDREALETAIRRRGGSEVTLDGHI
jgi:hypothetical protein